MATTTNTYLNSFKSFITEGFYLKKEKSYIFLYKYFSEIDDNWGFAFPTDVYNWTEKEFSQAMECFQNILSSEESKIYNFLNQPNLSSFSPLTQIDLYTLTTCIAKHFGYEKSKNKTFTSQLQSALNNEYKDYINAFALLKSIKDNNKELKGCVKEEDIKAIASLLKNIFAGLCLFLNRIKETTTLSSVSSSSNSDCKKADAADRKQETTTEDKQPQEGSTAQEQSCANAPEPVRSEAEPAQSDNQEYISSEDATDSNLEVYIEPNSATPEEAEEVLVMNEESLMDNNTKSSDDDNQIGEDSNGTDEKEAVSPSILSTVNSGEKEPSSADGKNDNNDTEEGNNNALPMLSREAILEKLERYEAIYRTFYFDELKSFLTKVNFNDSEDYYGYLHKVLGRDYNNKKDEYDQKIAPRIEELMKKSPELDKSEINELKNLGEKEPHDFSKAPYGFSCTPNDKYIVIAIEQFFEFLRKEENKELAEIMLHALSWCLSDVNGKPDISYCLKYGETFIKRIIVHFGGNIDSIKASNEKYLVAIECFKTIVSYKDYANPLHMLRIIRNLDVHDIQDCVEPKFWGRTIRLIIHTYIGAFYVANYVLIPSNKPGSTTPYRKCKFKELKTLIPEFIIKSDGMLILNKVEGTNAQEVWNEELEINSRPSGFPELENYQKYSWIWTRKGDKNNPEPPTPWTLRWNCADIKVILDKNPNPVFHLNTKFAEYLTAYIGEKFNVGVRLDSMEGSIANIARLMNGDETDARSIKSLLLAVLDKVEILGKEKSNVQEHIDVFSEQLEGISQALGEQPEKITEGVISGIKEMDLPADITKSIIERIDPKLDILVETTDKIKEDTAGIKKDTEDVKRTTVGIMEEAAGIKKETKDVKDTAYRIEDTVNEIGNTMARTAWHTKETADSVEELKKVAEDSTKKLSEIEAKLKSNPPQQGATDMPKGEGGPVYNIHVSGSNIGGISFGGDNTGHKVSGENTENTNTPTASPSTSPKSPEKEPASPANPNRTEQIGKGDSSNGGSSKWGLLLIVVIIIIGAYFLLTKGLSVEQKVTVITGQEQVANPKNGGGEPSDGPNTTEESGNPEAQPGQGPGDKTPPPVQPPTPKPQPKVDANYEAGMAAYNAGEGLEAIKKFKASNSAKANYMIGVIYENGCGNISANASMAHKYYKIAEEKGNK